MLRPLSPAPSLEKHPRDPQKLVEAGKETKANPSIVGFHVHPLKAPREEEIWKELLEPKEGELKTLTCKNKVQLDFWVQKE